MVSMIITDNVYIRIAINWMLASNFPTREICVIDLDSVTQIKKLIDTLEECRVNNGTEFFFIGNRNIYSQLFSKFNTIRTCCSLQDLSNLIKREDGVKLDVLQNHMKTYRALDYLSKEQLRVCILCLKHPRRTVAENEKLPFKKIHSIIYAAVRRMGMSTQRQLQCFISREYNFNELDLLIDH